MFAWTGVIAVLVVATSAGSVPPCPEASPVGLSEDELAAILEMCARRTPADWTRFALGIAIWLPGMIVVALLGGRWARRQAQVAQN